MGQRSSYTLKSSVLTAKERDHLRNELVISEGVDVSAIKIIEGKNSHILFTL